LGYVHSAEKKLREGPEKRIDDGIERIEDWEEYPDGICRRVVSP
jgi:hypothetical protein